MIDFGKTLKAQNEISHNKEWVEGNHEDGYLIGLHNLIDIFQSLIDE